MATLETIDKDSTGKPTPGPRRIRVQIRRINPWSVLKFSLIFYVCLLAVVLVGMVILFSILSSLGVIDSLEGVFGEFGFGTTIGEGEASRAVFEIDAGWVFRTFFLIGAISTVLWAVFTMFMTFLYNLIADLVGGVEVTLVERR
ncbi:MAG: DUF3566 domain-containing protein [Actinomycetota bacterium]